MHYAAVSIALVVGLALTGCASKPKTSPVPSTGLTQSPAAQRPEAVPTPQASRAGPAPGSQEDLAASAGDRVYFAVDQFGLEADARATLDRQAAWLARYPAIKILIAGNADERGTREYNVALGARRAEAARQHLIAGGVASTRIQTVSYGKERPVDEASNEDAWAKNRNAHTVLMDILGR
jgi:peptidoglycan-associated lipoprotein